MFGNGTTVHCRRAWTCTWQDSPVNRPQLPGIRRVLMMNVAKLSTMFFVISSKIFGSFAGHKGFLFKDFIFRRISF